MMRLCSGVPGVRSCGALIPQGSRSSSSYKCDRCRRETERNKSRRRRRSPTERKRRQAMIAAHVLQYGWTCPGYGCEPHESHDLTADHLHPVAQGGNEEGAALRVLSAVATAGGGPAHRENERQDSPSQVLAKNTGRKSGAYTRNRI